jgi:hypothetical protein
MLKANIVAGILALALFANAQYQGWNLFALGALQAARLSGISRGYHK